MSDQPFPAPMFSPQPTLTRSRSHRLVAGVLAGLHQHYRVPLPLSVFRALVVIVSVMTVFPGLLAYLLLWVLTPEGE
ncbi:PspC domain-containing protein [Deinococcus sonorensis]|uniref:PspC domain-containing protein n=2 Tax=Deinococcus sonorensis TaxID=309891 RepID=A0AAU7U5B0_9DEIO